MQGTTSGTRAVHVGDVTGIPGVRGCTQGTWAVHIGDVYMAKPAWRRLLKGRDLDRLDLPYTLGTWAVHVGDVHLLSARIGG